MDRLSRFLSSHTALRLLVFKIKSGNWLRPQRYTIIFLNYNSHYLVPRLTAAGYHVTIARVWCAKRNKSSRGNLWQTLPTGFTNAAVGKHSVRKFKTTSALPRIFHKTQGKHFSLHV